MSFPTIWLSYPIDIERVFLTAVLAQNLLLSLEISVSFNPVAGLKLTINRLYFTKAYKSQKRFLKRVIAEVDPEEGV
jgi:hypothetical protein